MGLRLGAGDISDIAERFRQWFGAEELDLDPADAEVLLEIRDRIRNALISEGWDNYWKQIGFRHVTEEPLIARDSGEEKYREVEVPDDAGNPERKALSREFREITAAAIERLPVLDKVCLRLTFGDDLSADRVARALSIEETRRVYYIIDCSLNRILDSIREATTASGPGDADAEDLKSALRTFLEVYYQSEEGDGYDEG